MRWLLALLIFIATAAEECFAAAANEVSISLVGSIDNHKRVNFVLHSDGATLAGYAKTLEYDINKPHWVIHPVKGTIDAQGKITLTQYLRKRREGTYKGKLISRNVFIGTFQEVASKDPPLPCLLRSVADAGALGVGKNGIIVTEHRYLIMRGNADEMRNKEEVNLPIVSGLVDRKIVSKIQRAFRVSNRNGATFSELLCGPDTMSVSYDVDYNKNYLLDLDITFDGVSAYDWRSTHHSLIDLRTGKRLLAKDVFLPSALGKVQKLASIEMRREAKKAVKDYSDLSGIEASERQSGLNYLRDEIAQHSFSRKDLNYFAVGDEGITFIYEWDFPHVSRCFEPSGLFFVPYTALRPYIQKDGPLAAVIAPSKTK
ncbi:MAG: hypothetical protein C5B53_13800 [Candidatus Melainabacteria bacterium]|nr:MAG: hypothetical protein C5B53_13800 [Candidatus Melainabacteria bacterium]